MDVNRLPRWRRTLLFGTAMLAGLLAAGKAALALHWVDKALPDLVMESEGIEMVRLEAKHSRWNGKGTLIVTDFHFLRERDLLGGRTAGERFVLTQGGGVIGNEGHSLSSDPELQVGARYLLFIDPERGELFAPFVGGPQGVYRLDADGLAHSLAGTHSLHVDDLLAGVTELVAQRGDAPARRVQPPPPPPGVAYPAKTWVPAGIAARPQVEAHSAHAPVVEADSGEPGPGDAPVEVVSAGVDEVRTPPWNATRYHYGPTVNFPVVYDEFPHDWSWSPHDQFQMSKWNDFVNGNLFLVSGSQLTTWSRCTRGP